MVFADFFSRKLFSRNMNENFRIYLFFFRQSVRSLKILVILITCTVPLKIYFDIMNVLVINLSTDGLPNRPKLISFNENNDERLSAPGESNLG